MTAQELENLAPALPLPREELIEDYRLAYRSRQASLVGRREVMAGKAKFGIFGGGKEVAQIALAKHYRAGDFRSGYYRDQTFMFAAGTLTIQQFFAQLYAHTDVAHEPSSGGRSMNAHFGTRSLNPDGSWKNLTEIKNSSPDISPTGSQMPRLVGLAQASKLYREIEALREFTQFSHNGNEIAFGTIGNASCAEGMFWEAINAAGVLKIPMVVSVWDDNYGISVTNEHQLTKQNLSALLAGFQREASSQDGYDIYTVRGWDYPALLETYRKATETARKEHVPALIHVTELTQPQGHSTSGSHERYKSTERLAWEREYDCLNQMRMWLLEQGIATSEELAAWEKEDKKAVVKSRAAAWEAFQAPIRADVQTLVDMLDKLPLNAGLAEKIVPIRNRLLHHQMPIRREIIVALREIMFMLKDEDFPGKQALNDWRKELYATNAALIGSHVYSESALAALRVPQVKVEYGENAPMVQGYQIMNACFDAALARDPRVVAFGEDVGRLGDVNQGFAGLQEKYGELRVADTGIRETTILGQAIGLAMRGLRPIAEIQYLDYLLYALQIMSDDLATVLWRTKGGQKAPAIIRTRGHRLEGVWHSGSPMAGVISLVRGVYVLTPRNMTQAAGFYNTLLQADDPALIVETLNGYRLRERMPRNIGEYTVPLGVPEVLRTGDDATIVTYGACVGIALDGAKMLRETGIEVEVIDVQSLLPFDIHHKIVASLQKTNRIVFLDEDMPGGTTAFMLQKVIEEQKGYYWLDSEPRTLTAANHRPAFGTDGNYWSKPNAEDVFELIYSMMHESDPVQFPIFF